MEYKEWGTYLNNFTSAYNNLTEVPSILKNVAPIIFQFRISDNSKMNFWFSYENEKVVTGMGENKEKSIPRLTHLTDFNTVQDVLSGKIDAIAATCAGKYKIIGDLSKLTACTPLLPLNGKAHKLIKK